jgi:hypothetical protein
MELHGIGDDDILIQQEPQKEKKPKSKLKGFIPVILMVVVVACLLIYDKVSESKKEAIEQQQLEEQQQVQEATSTPHDAIEYYLNEVRDPDYTNQAVAVAVAHVMSTGCTIAYDSLRDYFDEKSMEYLYDFVEGYACSSYEEPPYVLQEVGKDYLEYKIKFNSNRQYILHLNLDDDGYPTTFSIMYYETRDNILDESSKDINKSGNGKDHSDLTEVTTTEDEESITDTETTTKLSE